MQKKNSILRWPVRIELNRDTNYYFGLALLVVASLSILWAVFRDAFDAKDFLVYFLIYMWGYVLLLKSDFDLRVSGMEKAIVDMETKIQELTLAVNNEPAEDEGDEENTEENFLPGLSGMDEMTSIGKQDIYNEWTSD